MWTYLSVPEFWVVKKTTVVVLKYKKCMWSNLKSENRVDTTR